jgi:outer membrane lipoprotein SlyB
MNRTGPHALLLATLLSALPALATDAATTGDKSQLLATLCDRCAIVEHTRTEKRKGQASGAGAVGGAVAGGVVGKSATDSKAGAVGGAVIGGVLGHQIEKRVRSTKVWITTVTLKDGSRRDFESDSNPKWPGGTVVEVHDKQLKKR